MQLWMPLALFGFLACTGDGPDPAPTDDLLTQQVADDLGKRLPTHTVRVLQPLKLELEGSDGVIQPVYLDSLRAECMNDACQDARGAFVERTAQLSEVRDVPLMLSELQRTVALALQAPDLHQELGGDLVIGLSLPTEGGARLVRESELVAREFSPDDAFGVATTREIELQVVQDGAVWTLTSDLRAVDALLLEREWEGDYALAQQPNELLVARDSEPLEALRSRESWSQTILRRGPEGWHATRD
jgi:hypothetical protein